MCGTSISRLIWIIGTATVSRFSFSTARRFVYPFAPVLSRGLGVPLSAVTSLIAVNQVTGLFSILFAPIGDHVGYRVMMLTGLIVLVLGMFIGASLPFYGTLLIALFLAGLGKSLFDPALQAYVGARVPFERRGLAIGLIEMSWAGSALFGIPLIGLLIEHFDWQAPFFVLGGLALLECIALKFLIPDEGMMSGGVRYATVNFWSSWRRLGQDRLAMSVLGYAFFLNVANDNLFVVYGAWLEHSFSLSILAIGFSTSIIGLAELSGEGLTAFLSDRLGLQRALFIGAGLSALSYLALYLAETSLLLALAILFIVFVTFEFTIVTSISFFTEILPEARATMMSGFIAAAGIGRICGTLLGGRLWMMKHISVIGLTSACMNGLALFILFWGLRGWQAQRRS